MCQNYEFSQRVLCDLIGYIAEDVFTVVCNASTDFRRATVLSRISTACLQYFLGLYGHTNSLSDIFGLTANLGSRLIFRDCCLRHPAQVRKVMLEI